MFSERFRMRYVVKKELLYDPAIDLLGSTSPNMYISRAESGEMMKRELASTATLVSDFAPGKNIISVIWPEGTRVDEKKREAILKKLEKAAADETEEQRKKKEADPLVPFSHHQLYQRAQVRITVC